MIKESIICDNCGEERITDNPYPHTFTLQLSLIDTNSNSNSSQYMVYQIPPFDGLKHFCDKKCLSEWLNKK
jgi:hypothetical protein